MDDTQIKHFIEAALLAAGRPLPIDQMQGLFDGRSTPDKGRIRKAIQALNDDYEDRGIMIAEVASGFRIQVKAAMADRLQKLWEERPATLFARAVRDAGADRLSPARDARRDRGDPWRIRQQQHHPLNARA